MAADSTARPSTTPAVSIWHQLDAREVLGELQTDIHAGLSEAEVSRRLAEYGQNQLADRGAMSAPLILWRQVTELMALILMAAAAISAFLGDYKDSIAIGAIVILNTFLGFAQEYRAEKAMAALKKLSSPSVRVRRDGKTKEVPSARLVPGDVVLLEAGNVVPADCRVLESVNLQTQEASLTGESTPVVKVEHRIERAGVPLGDRNNMVYMGTFVSSGRGLAVAGATGMHTELGRIAGMIHGLERESTPLQRRLNQFGKGLAAAALSIVILIFIAGWLRGEGLKLLFLTAVGIGVAAVPEGLPAVVTIALTLGSQRMLKRKALIRRLSAVETLGSVTVICSDKTGTLTENRMSVTALRLLDQHLEVPTFGSLQSDALFRQVEQSGFGLLLLAAALCNDAIARSERKETASVPFLGDPTEVALLHAASRYGLDKSHLDKVLPRIAEAPFSSERKRMTTVHRLPADSSLLPAALRAAYGMNHPASLALMKGSVESLLGVCGSVWEQGKVEHLNSSRRTKIVAANDSLADNGMRVLGMAFRFLDAGPSRSEVLHAEHDFTFVGMIAMIDPPRPEAALAVATCRRAGIRPVMITGDHPLTAQYIARELGIEAGGSALTPSQMDRLSRDDLDALVVSASVYARVSPEHKLKIVESFQRRGHIVAMTGDGVNDAPALKKANIGVAMGITGTDVAKEAADMVLLDDNFATIVAAVEEGRMIYDNIRKFVRYILATNSGEIWLMLLAPLLGMPLPLLPLQILWMNLVTDGLPALALGVEPPESDVMLRPPRPTGESIFARGMGYHVLWVGLLMGVLALGVGFAYWRVGDPQWQTMVFTTLTLSQMAHVMAIRSERQSLFRVGFLSNKFLLGAVALTVIFQWALIYLPHLQGVFKTSALSGRDLAVAITVPVLIFWAVELEKWLMRRSKSH